MAETKTINTNNNNQEKEGKKILLPSQIGTDYNYKHKIVWFNTIGFLYLHLLAIYGIYRGLTGAAYFSTIAWSEYNVGNLNDVIFRSGCVNVKFPLDIYPSAHRFLYDLKSKSVLVGIVAHNIKKCQQTIRV